jgi:hypothetical protein
MRAAHSNERISTMKITRNIGMLLLAIWLIATGLISVLSLSFTGLGVIMAILAIAAGIFILIGR